MVNAVYMARSQEPMRHQRAFTITAIAALAVWASTCTTDSGGPRTGGVPAVDAGVDIRTQPGMAVPLTARVTAPGTGAYRWTLTWGDGAADSGSVGSTGLVTA